MAYSFFIRSIFSALYMNCDIISLLGIQGAAKQSSPLKFFAVLSATV